MLKIDVYHSGNSARVRLHHHPYAATDRCGADCDHETSERAYQPHKGSVAEYRKTTVAALVAVLLDPTISHYEFAYLVGEQTMLDFPA